MTAPGRSATAVRQPPPAGSPHGRRPPQGPRRAPCRKALSAGAAWLDDGRAARGREVDGTLREVLAGLQVLPPAVAVLGGAWALRRVRRAPVVDRPDRGVAIASAVVVAVMAALGTLAVAPSSNPVGGPIVLFLIVGIAFVVAVLAFLAALLGYVLLARPRIGAIALAGVLAGPLILGGTMALATAVRQELEYAPNRAPAATVVAEDGSPGAITR